MLGLMLNASTTTGRTRRRCRWISANVASSVSKLVERGCIFSDTNSSQNNSAASGNSTSVSVGGDTYINQQRLIPVSTAYAPALTSGIDTCQGSLSGGVQTGVFGISLGGTKRDDTCQLIKLSREAGQMGMPDVQCQVLALDTRFAEALRRAGRSCALPATAPAVAVAVPTTPAKVYIPQAAQQSSPVMPPFTGKHN